MQKATFAIIIPHFFLPISAYISETYHTLLILRFNSSRNVSNKSIEFLDFQSCFYTSLYLYRILTIKATPE